MQKTKAFSIFSLCLILVFRSSGDPEFCCCAAAGKAHRARRRRRRLCQGAARDRGQRCRPDRADLAGGRLRRGRGARPRRRYAAQEASAISSRRPKASGPDTVAMVYLVGLRHAARRRELFHPGRLPRSAATPTFRSKDCGSATTLRQLASASVEGQHRRARCGAAAALYRRRPADRERARAGRAGSPHMLIAFNAAPGTVAPNEPGPYGAYAQALAEMIRTGGLPLPEVFDRVRLRVNEASKGAQMPWDAEKIDVQFTFFDRAPDAPPAGAAGSGRRDPRAADPRSRRAGCLSPQRSNATPCQAMRISSRPIPAIRWPGGCGRSSPRGAKRSPGAAPIAPIRRTAYWSYLRRYPRGPHAWDARRRLAHPVARAGAAADIRDDRLRCAAAAARRNRLCRSPGAVCSAIRISTSRRRRRRRYSSCRRRRRISSCWRRRSRRSGCSSCRSRSSCRCRSTSRPPVYVAPPPNNIIFNNIHNTTVINNVINRPAAAANNIAAGAANAQPGGVASREGRAGAGRRDTGCVGPQLPHSAMQKASLIQREKRCRCRRAP